MRIKDITHAAETVLRMLGEYHVAKQGELAADAVLYGFLSGKYEGMSRQHKIKPRGLVKPRRIDFRFGGNNSKVIELVLRKPHDPRSKLFASQNRPELAKLTRVTSRTAKCRVLLLLDRSKTPIPEADLRARYRYENAGRGNFQRHSIRVIYVSKKGSYNFLWRPHAGA